jgi:PleD family two-component response regulator
MAAVADRRDAVRVLFVDDEFIEFRSLRKKVAELTEPTVAMEYAQSVDDALTQLSDRKFDLILLDTGCCRTRISARPCRSFVAAATPGRSEWFR